MKCVVCHSKATYIMSGNSLCTHCAEEHQLGYGKDLLTLMSEKGYFDGKLEKYKPKTTFMSEKNYDIYMQLLGDYDQTRKLKINKMTK